MANPTLQDKDIKLPRYIAGAGSHAILALMLTASLSAADNLTMNYFSSMDKRFFDGITYRFAQAGASHLAQTRQQLFSLSRQTAASEASDLRLINDLLNRIPQVEDAVQWGMADYWASPAEFIASNGGDCEDFVIAKYFALRESGIPAEKLRMTYVKSAQKGKIENHMVLAYYAAPEAEPLLLDNIQPQLLPASKRPDLLPVYEFNGELTTRFSGPAMRKWELLLNRINQEFER